jgi:hypothetical protein
MLNAASRTVKYHGRTLQFMGDHNRRDDIPAPASLRLVADEVLGHLDKIQPGAVVFNAPLGQHDVKITYGETSTEFTVKTSDQGIVVKTPMAFLKPALSASGRRLFEMVTIPRVADFTSELESMMEGAVDDIVAGVWKWPDDSCTLDFEHESSEFGVMFQLKLVSEGTGYKNKYMTYTCCTVAELAVFIDTFLDTYVWDSICAEMV